MSDLIPKFSQSLVPLKRGTTGTGLDSAIEPIGSDGGLTHRISGAALTEGMAAADGINGLIVRAIKATGVANDGTLTASDLYNVSAWIRNNHLAAFTALHGDDEGNVETGFHQVQGDGADARLFGQNAVDTVLDGMYHIGFAIKNGRFVNEDGNANARVEDVAFWLSAFLQDDLAAGRLANAAVDPQLHGTTGTGLDALVETIVDDPGLNDEISHAQINAGARAADGMNKLVVQGIRALGIADDGYLSNLDLRDLNAWIRANHLAEWTTLHGDDENGVETGFHLVQGDGGTSYLFGEKAVNTIADGLYHLGFAIQWGRFVNEDGNGNASVDDVAEWLNLLLADDLQSGALGSGRTPTTPGSFASALGYQYAKIVTVDNDTGQVEAGKQAALRVAQGTFALRFVADAPDRGDYQVLFSKDGASNLAGDISVFLYNGHIHASLQDGKQTFWLKVEDYTIEAGKAYDLAVSFGAGGLEISLNGRKVAANDEATTGLAANARSMVIGAGTWGRSSTKPTVIWDHFDGRIEGFTFYNRALDAFEIAGLAKSPALALPQQGAAAMTGAQPAVLAGTGLTGQVFDRTGRFSSIADLVAQSSTQTSPNALFTASRIDFGAVGTETTLGAFLGDAGVLQGAGAATDMTTLGLKLSGFIWLEAGTHLITVRSDDGFQLSLGGQTISSYSGDRGFEGTSRQITIATSGLYALDLFYFENQGDQGLRLEIDGEVAGADRFFRSLADYQAALAAYGEMPAAGLSTPYAGPIGTTGTGLDRIIRMIGEDEGLQHNISRAQLMEGAAAADTINALIVKAIRATGVANDGVITTSETYDIGNYIRTHDAAAFVAAHGDDENGLETGFHLLQNDGGTTRIFAEAAVNTVFDGLYHIGFQTTGDRFANEDGNANARVEDVAFWLNTFLQNDLSEGKLANNKIGGPAPTGLLGSVANPNVSADKALTSVLAPGALTLKLIGDARNGFGNSAANTLTGNTWDNLLDGSSGNDKIDGGLGNDILIGGAGADSLAGGGGNDVLSGGTGNDVLSGGLGNDTLTGGMGVDRFVFNSRAEGIDEITDFISGTDRLVIDSSGFDNVLPVGALSLDRLVTGADASANASYAQFIFNSRDGSLWLDRNGTVTGGLVHIVDLGLGKTIAASDFEIVA